MPRMLTKGGISLVERSRNFETTEPNDGCGDTRLVFSVKPVMTSESECSSTESTERITAILSHMAACCGKCSLICTPGTLVAIGLNSPLNSAGASGFRSYMSMCDGPPGR
jgi:hypothetical protein